MKIILMISLAVFLQASPSCSERFFAKKTTVEKSSFNPYHGKVNGLLKTDVSSGLLKFKLVGTVDVDTYPGSTEAKGFTYMQVLACSYVCVLAQTGLPSVVS